MGCAKILLFVFNLIFVILGIVLIVSGVLVTTSDSQDFDVLSTDNEVINSFGSAGWITIFLGVIVFIVAFCGCCGAVKESKVLLTIFIVLLLIILVIEIVGAVLGYVFRGKVDDTVTEGLMDGLKQYKYNANNSIQITWDKVQTEGKCCGVVGPDDWTNATAGGAIFPMGRDTPQSCACMAAEEGCGEGEVWKTGCREAILSALLGNLAFSGTACIVIILAEIFGIIFACCVIKDNDKETA